MIDVLSNNSEFTFTPEELRKLAASTGSRDADPTPVRFQFHRLSARLSPDQLEAIVQRYGAGESATSLAGEFGVAPSALLRLFRERSVVVRRYFVTAELEAAMAKDYEAGMTMAKIEAKHGLSHNAVLRALRRAGVEMRPMGRPRKSVW
jgi:hypothetical protein